MTLKDSQRFQPQVIQCQNTKVCKNNKCFWRQRDEFGLSAFLVLNNPEWDKKQKDIYEKYGKSYFPEWIVSVGTNCLYVTCKDRI